jgi:nucleotide-binding universal stress UspA family protein
MPAHAILAAAEEEDAEMIILGSCHHGVVGRILMGSTAEDVMRDASCPVAIAPNGYAQELAYKLFGAERSIA